MENKAQEFSWEVFRKNIKFLRKHYKLNQEDVANGIGSTRSAHQYCEAKGVGGMALEVCAFWYKNFSITPNDLLIKELNKDNIKIIENRIRIEKFNKKLKVTIKRK